MHRCTHRTDITSRSSTVLLSSPKTTATFAGIFFWIVLLFLTAPPLDLSAKERPKAKSTPVKSAPAKPAPVKPLPKPYNPLDGVIFPDSTMIEELADGISHHLIHTADNQVANVIIIDIRRGGRIGSYKALDLHDGLENAADIARRAMSSLRDTVLAATNASFWRAGSNTPIGATISNGEVLELPGYKLWSSLMIFDDGTAEIDRISLRGNFRWSRGALSIDGVNRRGKDDGVVLYNDYYGDSLPHGSYKSDSAIVAEAFANRVGTEVSDETEGPIDTAALVRDYREEKLLQDREHPLRKIVCTFPKPRRKRAAWPTPKVGEPMTLIVTACDTGVVEVPEHGVVISIGPSVTVGTLPRVGDTVTLAYTITPRQDKKVVDLLTGTPRLVRNGRAEPEYEIEGSKARRFIRSELARTAVGISRGGDTLFLVTIDSPNRSEDRRGMTLSQLADLMRSIGAYDAMNFDGGGSASMSINGSMISRQGSGPSRRRVSNALVVIKKALLGKPPRSLIDQDTTSN